ncbi:MAG TPA: hypothetical protein VK130_11665 [Steroidobacteraceae bacterium]|nr:hypothetical protein [Steroidobacteraceae bacterium]
MSKQIPRTAHAAHALSHSTALPPSRLTRAGRALRLATELLIFGSQFVPLGDNRALLADLAVRARAARDYGA